MQKHLLLGCGHTRDKRIRPKDSPEWGELTTVDINPLCKPDVRWDLRNFPYPWPDNTFDEVHAYEVLEHTGIQGDIHFFFIQFYELWRILKPNGILCGSVPLHTSMWAWGDPGHSRVITAGSFIFLSQAEYEKQIGQTAMSDYREWWKGDFRIEYLEEKAENLMFALRAIKGETT